MDSGEICQEARNCGRQPQHAKQTIGRRGQVLTGVHERAVEVEQDGAERRRRHLAAGAWVGKFRALLSWAEAGARRPGCAPPRGPGARPGTVRAAGPGP